MKKYIKADYIESGTFQGGEEDASLAGIEFDEEVIIMKKSEFKRLKALATLGESVVVTQPLV